MKQWGTMGVAAALPGWGRLTYNPHMPRQPRTTGKIMRRASELRSDPTKAEAMLWAHLRLNQLDGIRFRRQHSIGRYIVDFCSPTSKLVIELDGSQHLQQTDQDAERTEFLQAQGYRVLRFWNSQVLNDFDAVVRAIQQALAK